MYLPLDIIRAVFLFLLGLFCLFKAFKKSFISMHLSRNHLEHMGRRPGQVRVRTAFSFFFFGESLSDHPVLFPAAPCQVDDRTRAQCVIGFFFFFPALAQVKMHRLLYLSRYPTSLSGFSWLCGSSHVVWRVSFFLNSCTQIFFFSNFIIITLCRYNPGHEAS